MIVDERTRWTARARRFRHSHGNWCHLCEKRTWRWWLFTFRARLEVHHCDGRGIRSQVGFEDDAELMVLCCRCHDRITTRHRRLGRQRGQVDWNGRTIDRIGYSHTIRQVTDAADPAYLRRAIHRVMHGMP